MRILVMTAAAAMLTAACASAPPTDGTQIASAKNEKVCRNTTATGSNMPTRVCSSKEESEAIAKRNRAGVEEFERELETAPTPGGVGMGGQQ